MAGTIRFQICLFLVYFRAPGEHGDQASKSDRLPNKDDDDDDDDDDGDDDGDGAKSSFCATLKGSSLCHYAAYTHNLERSG